MTTKTLWLLTMVVFIALLLPALVQQGMFLDGVTHACIAKNMANGLGEFARPYYTPALDPVFFGQPPLALWLQSLFFRCFGDHFWTERLYSFVTAILSGYGILLIVRQTHKTIQAGTLPLFSNSAWLPILLWISFPVVYWSYQNNMLECTMSIFVLFATYYALKSVLEKNAGLLIIAAIWTAAAVMCKGPVGFFPLVTPLAAGIAFRTTGVWVSTYRTAVLSILTLAILFMVIRFVPGMQSYFELYWHKQLIPTLSGANHTQAETSLKIFQDLIAQLILPAVFIGILIVKRGMGKIQPSRASIFFFMMALLGSLPLLISPKQSAHYLLPSMPFFALGFAEILQIGLPLGGIKSTKTTRMLEKSAWAGLVVCICLSLSFWGKYRRDEGQIRDIKVICAQLNTGNILQAAPKFCSDWLLIAYLGRLGNIGLDCNSSHDFCLLLKGEQAPLGYIKSPVVLNQYELWQKQ